MIPEQARAEVTALNLPAADVKKLTTNIIASTDSIPQVKSKVKALNLLPKSAKAIQSAITNVATPTPTVPRARFKSKTLQALEPKGPVASNVAIPTKEFSIPQIRKNIKALDIPAFDKIKAFAGLGLQPSADIPKIAQFQPREIKEALSVIPQGLSLLDTKIEIANLDIPKPNKDEIFNAIDKQTEVISKSEVASSTPVDKISTKKGYGFNRKEYKPNFNNKLIRTKDSIIPFKGTRKEIIASVIPLSDTYYKKDSLTKDVLTNFFNSSEEDYSKIVKDIDNIKGPKRRFFTSKLDMANIYMGLPQEFDSIEESPYELNGEKAFRLNPVASNFNPQKFIDSPRIKKFLKNNNGTTGKDSITQMRMGYQSEIDGGYNYADLNDYSLSYGSDERGNYLAIYDIIDYKVGAGFGSPFEVYDRIYIDDNGTAVYP